MRFLETIGKGGSTNDGEEMDGRREVILAGWAMRGSTSGLYQGAGSVKHLQEVL